jgi:hypothetical protein
LKVDVHAYLHAVWVKRNYLTLIFLEHNLTAWLDGAALFLIILFISDGHRDNWSLYVKHRRLLGLVGITVVDAGILLGGFSRWFLVLLLQLQLIHYLFLDRHNACWGCKWLLRLIVLKVAGTQGSRVDLLLAHKLLHARVD